MEMTAMNALALVLGSGWHHHSHWWIVFPILVLLLAGLVAALLLRGRHGPGDGGDSARRILGERFARGEINADEYRERLGQLQ